MTLPRILEGEDLKRVKLPLLAQQGLPSDTVMTCDECAENETCRSAFDAYNTGGDCLEDK